MTVGTAEASSDASTGASSSGSSPLGCALEVDAGSRHACARTSTGRVWCWGDTTDGVSQSATLNMVGNDAEDALTVDGHACYRVAEGDGFGVRCWGSNAAAAIDGSGDASVFPPRALSDVNLSAAIEHVAVTATSTCVAETQEVYCRGTIAGSVAADQALPDGRRVVEVATGRQHVCVRDDAGAVWCAGDNALGQLGRGGSPEGFVQVELPEPVQHVVAERESNCAVTADGIWCWGRNSNGQIAPGGQPSEAPSRADVDGNPTFARVAMGPQTTCALDSEGALYCWGGSLCDGLTFAGYQAVQNLDTASLSPTALAVGRDFVCVTSADRRTLCAGNDELGQLGGGATARTCVTALEEVMLSCE